MSDLKKTAADAMGKIPQPMQRALRPLGVQVQAYDGKAAPLAGGLGPGNSSVMAGVEKGSPNTIKVLDQSAFEKSPEQLLTHEGKHLWENNLPPSIQAAIPADNPNDPYNFGGDKGVSAILNSGKGLKDMPREAGAAALQYGVSQGMPKLYQKLADTMNDVPMSQIDMTDPNASAMNMHPRAPMVPPRTVPGMNFATETYQKGDPPPGNDDPWQKAAVGFTPEVQPGTAAKAPESAPEDYSVWNTKSASGDEGNPIQQRLDDAINTPSETGPRSLDSFGRGAAQAMLSPIAHPIEAAKGFAKSVEPDAGVAGLAEGAIGGPAGPFAVHALRGLYDDYQKNGAAHVLGNLAGSFMGGEATGGVLRGAGRAAQATGAGIDNAILGTTAGDVERGANPGKALSTNRIFGSNPRSLLSGVKEAVPEANAAHNADIARFTRPGSLINTGPLISEPFNAGVTEATDPVTGAAMPSQISKTRKTQTALTNELDPGSGQVTTSLRNPFMTPLQANRLKSNIYSMTDYDNPSRAAISNSALKGSARNLKSAIESEVPESKISGQRLHDLMSAKDILTPQAEGTKLMPASKAGLIERGTTALGTGAAAGLDVLGSGLRPLGSAARFALAPLLVPRAYSSDAYARGSR